MRNIHRDGHSGQRNTCAMRGLACVMCAYKERGNARRGATALGREEREPLRGLGLGLDEVVDDRVEEGACAGLNVRTLSRFETG